MKLLNELLRAEAMNLTWGVRYECNKQSRGYQSGYREILGLPMA